MSTVETGTKTKQLWTCPNCGRQFERQRQVHSCRPYALELHFRGKAVGKLLYEKFKDAVEKAIGPIKVESLECCIHFVSTFTFAAIKIYKNKIMVDFSLGRKLENPRIFKHSQVSLHAHYHFIYIEQEDEIDIELMEWIREANERKQSSVH